MKHHHILFLLRQRGLTAISLAGGLGVGNHHNGLHEVQALIYVICFVHYSRGEGLPIKTRLRDVIKQFRSTFPVVSFDFLWKTVETVTTRVQNCAKMKDCMLKSDVI